MLEGAFCSSGETTGIFSPRMADEIRHTTGAAGGEDTASRMLDNAAAPFGLGFQVHDFVLRDGTKCRSMGHSGLGGSIALYIPEIGLSFAFTTNTLGVSSTARKEVITAICEELAIAVPPTLVLS